MRWLNVLLVCLMLSACGQYGRLYLPTTTQTEQGGS